MSDTTKFFLEESKLPIVVKAFFDSRTAMFSYLLMVLMIGLEKLLESHHHLFILKANPKALHLMIL